ncbi:MAG: hypothetical protein H6741_21995 [Alphaproteobacteria bacterium]|nr:hypothetical protein [Alphaproteobacteria bacterium]MCB9795385.1 hypothetical protein [Alphaproteobacteria bacterium]
MNAALPRYPRAFDPPESPRPMLILQGRRRALALGLYGLITAVALGGLLYTALTAPALALGGLALCYVLENLMFVLGHLGLHAAFIELREGQMATLTHHAFLHHYRDIHAFHKSWLETRLSYFLCPIRGLRSPTTYGYLIAYLLTAGLVAAASGWAAGLAALSGLFSLRLLQSLCHEWYHQPDRVGYYWRPTRWLLSALERLGVLSTLRHRRHHRHHLKNLHEVHHWVDMSLPGADRLGDAIWRHVLREHRAGERRMMERYVRVFAAYSLGHYALIGLFFALGARALGV